MATLKRYKIKTYIHRYTKGYPTDIDTIVSKEGYGANPYIKTKRKIILVTAPGPASGSWQPVSLSFIMSITGE